MQSFIPVCEPFLNGNELKYVDDCVKSGWISSSGKYVDNFEKKFAEYCGAKYAVAVCNGTVALHLSLIAIGITEGDEVIIPNFTMIASAFAVCYCRAIPVFVDAENESWVIDTDKIEKLITPKTKAIMAVSIFGHPCEMDTINAIAKKYNLLVIEDAAESHGAEYKGIKSGNLADITAFSFFANKNLTTGEGGMIVTNDELFYNQTKYYKNLCFPLNGPRNYLHNDIGYNYRMSNIHAAIGLAQVEKADFYKNLRIKNANLYKFYLSDIPGISMQINKSDILNVHWMNCILVDENTYGKSKIELQKYLLDNNVETRNLFMGMNKQPSLLKYGCKCDGDFEVTNRLTETGFYLPSASSLEEKQIELISKLIKNLKNNI
jgi:perosamine synthetase